MKSYPTGPLRQLSPFPLLFSWWHHVDDVGIVVVSVGVGVVVARHI